MNTFRIALAAGTALGLAAISPAFADVTFTTGNQQYTNVNMDAQTGSTASGQIGSTGPSVTFENMVSGVVDDTIHAGNGVAFIQNNDTTAGFSSVDMVAQSGTGWTAGDFKLDLLNSVTCPSAGCFVSFTTLEADGSTKISKLLIKDNGQSPYQFTTSLGEIVTMITFGTEDPTLLADIKQVSLQATNVVPLPGALPLFATGLAGLGMLNWRRKRKAAA